MAPPKGDVNKFNADAHFDASLVKGCSGIVGRDKEGTLVTGSSSKFFAKNALVAEAIAVREAITLASGLQIASILLESDCLVVIEMCRGNMIRREIDQIIHDILSLKGNFSSVGFTWTKRDRNSVADMVAKLGSMDALNSDWIYNPLLRFVFWC